MPARSQLLERCGDLKQELVAYVEHRRFRREIERVLRDRLDPYEADEDEVANALDYFILEHRLPDRKTVLEHFVQDHTQLTAEERSMLLGWHDVVAGVFEVKRRSGDALVAVNLVDELEYRLVSNVGGDATAAVRTGTFLVTRIVPLEDEWMMSGMASLLDASERDRAYEMAADIVLAAPAAIFRNPEKLARAWEIQRKDRDDFIALFGTDTLIVPGHELEEHLRRFVHYKLHEVRDEDGRTAAERASERSGVEPELPMPDLDPELLEAETVGVIYDEQDGFWFLPDYGLLAETFASPELAREKHHRGIVQQYVEDPDLPPLPLRRLAAHDPERATTVIRTVERRPDFEWQRDGEALLRRHKPSFYDRPPIPEVTPLSEPLIAAQARLAASLAEEIDAMLEEMAVTAKVGRNDPCPCGSDKKYKRCCGA